ncbi:lipid-A-disaccharide synthase [Mucilaginibacter ginkgonis]|uniref:Lipid-A-disaccharide synthase n=1 Tax=Mucilaginibacter ginkgonis TaxID=2682091 RepID=A0A6I4I0H8_9SPHI|nr:lipid-A-disaccharide synthase [Mucilaginibacter ginkgonis]QQL48332.1 lipid-A-disaccharide synthase [Mucilaginibacter ginkgonis]
MKYYLVAGEASGDLHGANLMKELKLIDREAEFRFFGGDLMQAQGGILVKHYAEMAYMGVVEVVMNIRTIAKNMAACKKDISNWQPDVVILIDFPGFNLKIAEFAKNNGLLTCFYISPKVWAWNQKRVLKIKRVVDHLFCILPFEVDFYKSWGMEVDYVGNPLLDAIAAFTPDQTFLPKYKLEEKPMVALLPGSRKQEIVRLLPVMLSVVDKLPAYQFVVAGAPSFDAAYYDQFFSVTKLPIIFNATYDLLVNAQAAIVASGTATLETALFDVPQVVVYKASPLFIGLARIFVKLNYISLVNLIMDKLVVKELIQEDCDTIHISAELDRLLKDQTYRSAMLANYDELDLKMGEPGASAKTAGLIVKYVNNSSSIK